MRSELFGRFNIRIVNYELSFSITFVIGVKGIAQNL
jgi:hypothetical protein